ncbi:peptidoglycan-binding protein LysM [Celeribacter indicus]|uniref:LysM domain/BON superfamily protein n=1 Tax=Celeribacter indicus TaxID=1208324 RepID=A0A0B5DQ21_9RHOB|nr:peptidoglycan-binding protein LysM [Celeribacter indicus]AJE45643.1 LysM domain/BON superfamily protein [Celeribacter indicus]SDW83831.1 BON domain-containing protein [Celeribacter indicus]
MGIFSFLKGAGKKVAKGEAAKPSEDDLLAEIRALGLKADGLKLDVDGDTVKLSGDAASQEEKEKIILAVGNVEGIAAVEDSVPGTEPRFHEVRKGDTLWAIAEKTLGNGARYTEIFEANKPMLSHPDKIYPGQVLRIPQDTTA